MAAAAQSFNGYKHDIAEFGATLAADDPRRKLLAEGPAVLEAQMQLVQGNARSALAAATEATLRIASIASSGDDVNSRVAQNRMLSAGLYFASEAAVRLGRHAQAEALARRLLNIPPDPANGAADSQRQISEVQIILARALAGQGRLGGARAALQPALDWYRKQLAAGAYETQFRQDFAYALYVDAIAQQSDPAGRKQRAADLDQAGKLIAGASADAQKMADMKYTAGLIAKARTATQT
jgi:tetratricopeptide (TPR) repeat protein